jgi:hypothetical protein
MSSAPTVNPPLENLSVSLAAARGRISEKSLANPTIRVRGSDPPGKANAGEIGPTFAHASRTTSAPA